MTFIKIKTIVILLFLFISPLITHAAQLNNAFANRQVIEIENDSWYEKGKKEGVDEVRVKPFKIDSVLIFLYMAAYYLLILVPFGLLCFFYFKSKKLYVKIMLSILFAALFIILLLIIHQQNETIIYL